MSSKGRSFAEKSNVAPLVPKLRFPEFREAASWKLVPMETAYTFKGNNSLSRDKLNYTAGSLKNIHYGDIHTKFSVHFDITREIAPFVNEEEIEGIRSNSFCDEGDLILADASEDLADIGKCIEIINLNGEEVVSGLHTILARPDGRQIALGFGGYLFNSPPVRRQIKKEAQGAKVLGISPKRLQSLSLTLPPALSEQEKIADCLASADALVATQGRKVEVLKAYKKGLMQQLFPQEGKTQPRLRFPEFEEAKPWEPYKLEELCKAKISYGIVQAGPHVPEGMPYIKSTDLNSELQFAQLSRTSDSIAQKYRRSEVLPGDIVFSLRGNIGVSQIVPRAIPVANLTQGTARIRTRGPAGFYLAALRSQPVHDRIVAVSKGSTFQEISLEELRGISLYCPETNEQRRIAACLSSLDDLITAETRKLNTLKIHKKGLMQQLFPQVGED